MLRLRKSDSSSLEELYNQRSTRFVSVWTVNGWRFKVYHISVFMRKNLPIRYHKPTKETIKEALKLVNKDLLNYRVGFCGVHEGTRGLFVFVDWWSDKKELHHVGYYSEYREKLKLERLAKSEPIACVWDLRIMSWEAMMWALCTGLEPDYPRVQDYLRKHYR